MKNLLSLKMMFSDIFLLLIGSCCSGKAVNVLMFMLMSCVECPYRSAWARVLYLDLDLSLT